MGAPKFAIATDKGRYYDIPTRGERYISVTNALNQWHIEGLAPAAAKETAAFFARNLPRAVALSRDPARFEEFIAEAKAHYKTLWERRADIGTRVHDRAEAHVLGTPMPADDEAEPFVEQYLTFFDEFNVDIDRDIDAVEITVVNHTHRYAGTADLWINLEFPEGTGRPHPKHKGRRAVAQETPSGLWLVDIKTSMTKPAYQIYRDMILQLAGLRFAEFAQLRDGTEVDVPPAFVGAAILNLRQTEYAFVPLSPLVERDAFEAFCRMVRLAYFAHELDLIPYKPIAPPVTRRGALRKAS
ncbi:hypothetical protein [Phytoactinopolyspora limicola]|uniref:hypothetical protein n=1 Tax=Phytoactinopolyspora limicola TaxID=2715536 RepID=UPI00140A3C2F|nr:hypothetical protein [Phytoactinopolyspora limicola]